MLPGWTTASLPVEPISLALPVPHRARFYRTGITSDAWISRRFGGTSVIFEEEAFVLIQPYVYGATLLDSFNIDELPEQQPEEEEVVLCWPLEELRLGPMNTIRDLAVAQQEVLDRINGIIRCFNGNMQKIHNALNPNDQKDLL